TMAAREQARGSPSRRPRPTAKPRATHGCPSRSGIQRSRRILRRSRTRSTTWSRAGFFLRTTRQRCWTDCSKPDARRARFQWTSANVDALQPFSPKTAALPERFAFLDRAVADEKPAGIRPSFRLTAPARRPRIRTHIAERVGTKTVEAHHAEMGQGNR